MGDQSSDDPANAFMQRTFRCEKMAARISEDACIARQDLKPPLKNPAMPRHLFTPFDLYCMSGRCPKGCEIKAARVQKEDPAV